jgi:hypothetical protein
LFFGGNLRGAKPPKAKNGVFISRRLIFRVGGQNEEIIYISELLDKAFKRSFKILAMFLLGFDFSYKGSVFSTKPTANGTPISFGFSSTNFNITQIKFLIGLYASQNFIFQTIFSPQIVSLTFNGDNGSSNGSNLGFGIGGNMLFPVSKQFYIGFGMDFDYITITSITTTYSENTNF